MLTLRPYQQECIDSIPEQGNYLIQMATGLGKTVTFSQIPRHGRMLILSHREELVTQPLKYFECTKGIEMGKYHASPWDEVVSASVQTMTHRLDQFAPDEFDIVVCDEAHHSAARSYRKVLGHFQPRLLLGFTATPSRGDKVRLDDIYTDIIFQRDLKWGIQNNYLSDIYCRRVNIGYDISKVKTSHGDFAPGELDEAMDGTADAIAEAYTKLAQGATLIFAVSVNQANEIAKRIPNAAVVTGETDNRAQIIKDFSDRKIPCIVNVMVFTEGTDIPLVETIIIARPTQSDSLYTQMVGRGLRLSPGKERLNLIDCVGISGKASLCTAPSLLGINLDDVPEKKKSEIIGPLFDLPMKAVSAADCPESWIKNILIIDLWAKEQKYQTHDVNWFKMPDGSFVCSLPEKKRIVIPKQNELGMTEINGIKVPMQTAFDRAYVKLKTDFADSEALWNMQVVRRWGTKPASEKQITIIRRRCKGFETTDLNMMQASMILNRVMGGKKAG